MAGYVTLAQLKLALGIGPGDTADDARLTTVAHQATGLVDEYLRQIRPGYVGFAGSSNTRGSSGSNTRHYDGTGQDEIFIDDAQSVASVTVDSTAIDSDDYEPWPYNEVPKRSLRYKQPVSSIRGLTADIWSIGTRNIAVTGYFGLSFIPEDVYEVTLALAVILWRRQQLGEYKGSSKALNSQRFSTGQGRQFQYVVDPEIAAALSQLDPGWAVGGVWGG